MASRAGRGCRLPCRRAESRLRHAGSRALLEQVGAGRLDLALVATDELAVEGDRVSPAARAFLELGAGVQPDAGELEPASHPGVATLAPPQASPP